MSKTVLITGGSRGIGRACVQEFASHGWETIFCFARNQSAADELCARVSGLTAYQCDVSDERAVEEMFARIKSTFGRLDAVVCNAGISHFSLFTDLTAERWEEVFSVNTRGTFLCLREAAKLMISQKSGAMAAVSSMWGQVGGSCETAYSASKAAVIGLCKALAKELGPSGIRVNCVCPGVIDTEMNANLSPETMEELRQETSLGTIGRPEDVATVIYDLCSARSAFVTGQIIGVNGGMVI